MTAPSSPCVQICVMDPLSGLCIGCGRTREEIAAWLSLGEAERRTIMAELGGRLVAARSRKARGRAFSRSGG
jgi:uncharacterized protein